MEPERWDDRPAAGHAAPGEASTRPLLVALVGLAAVLVAVVAAYLLVVVPRQQAAEREARIAMAQRAPVVRAPVVRAPEPLAPSVSVGPAAPAGWDGPPEDPARAPTPPDEAPGDLGDAPPEIRAAEERAAERRAAERPPTPAEPAPRPAPARPGSAEATADLYLARMAGRSVPQMLALYASRVRYYDRGVVSQDAVERDKADYARRWPERRYTRTSSVASRPGPDGTRTLRFDYDLAVRGEGRERAGRAWTELDVEAFEGALLIRGERGGTY